MLSIFTAIGSIISSVFGFFLAQFSHKAAVGTASVLAFIATTLTMVICMKTIILTVITLITLPTWLVTGLAMFIPSNTVGVFSAILSARICKFVYGISKEKIQLLTQA